MMDIDINILTPRLYSELHQTFKAETKLVMEWRWVSCSDEMQRVWEEAVERALVRVAILEDEAGQDGHGAASLLLKRLSTTGHRHTNIHTLAAVIFEELAKRHENGRAPLGLDRPWESRSNTTHEVWAAAIRKALSRTGLSSENPGADGYCLHLPRKSGVSPLLVFQVMALKREADRKAAEGTSSPSPSVSEVQQQLPQPPQPQQEQWWRFWR
jgi:hypothetical protein